MRLSDRLQGLCAQSWAKPGLGKKPYNTKKYGTVQYQSPPSIPVNISALSNGPLLFYFIFNFCLLITCSPRRRFLTDKVYCAVPANQARNCKNVEQSYRTSTCGSAYR